MILRRTIIVITIVIIATVISAGLLILGISKGKNDNVDIYSDSVNENIELSNEEGIYDNSKENSTESDKEVSEQPKSDESSNNSNVIQKQQNNTSNNANINDTPITTNNNINTNANTNTNNNNTNNTNESKTVEKTTENVVEKKEDVYTFAINNSEIQNMINIAKRLIRENKDNRYAGLVDCVDNINFVIQKSGNVFYPLFEYRISNIVMDNYYPEFYVYAEDVYKNGEYLRTEYYFQ